MCRSKSSSLRPYARNSNGLSSLLMKTGNSELGILAYWLYKWLYRHSRPQRVLSWLHLISGGCIASVCFETGYISYASGSSSTQIAVLLEQEVQIELSVDYSNVAIP